KNRRLCVSTGAGFSLDGHQGPAGYFLFLAGSTLMLFITCFTPSTPRATVAAWSASAAVPTVPVSLATPSVVSTAMSSALSCLSATKAALTLVVTVASEAYSPTDCLGLPSLAAKAMEVKTAPVPSAAAAISLRNSIVVLLVYVVFSAFR